MPKKILIADDDPNMIRILRQVLESDGYAVVSASNGVQALEKAQREQPDLLILDLMMPVLDGFGLLMRLYGEDPPLEAPAILLTAQNSAEYRDTAEALGAVRFLEKPFDIDELSKVVKDVLKRTGQEN
ncbi:MAG: response regulator [Calditrichaeota bacterium]|nr:response regulator [Calditrichota bacterium]